MGVTLFPCPAPLAKAKTASYFMAIGALLFILLTAIHLFGYNDMTKLNYENAKEEAVRNAEYLKSAVLKIISVSERGGGIIDLYVEALNEEQRNRLELVHSLSITSEYSFETEEEPQNDKEKASLIDGKVREFETKDFFVSIQPLVADKSCQRCHHLTADKKVQVPIGYVLGLLKISIPKTMLKNAQQSLTTHTAESIGLSAVLLIIFWFGIHQLTNELRKSEQENIAVLKSAGEGIVSAGADSIIRSVNGEVASIFGYKEEELIGQNLEILMPEKSRSLHADGMKRYLGGGKPHVLGQRIELDGQRKNGDIFPLELRIEETVLNVGKERLFTASIRDITKRRQAEKEILRSKAMFEAIFRAEGDAVIFTDTERKIAMVNNAVMELFGYNENELRNKTTSLLYESVEEYERQGKIRFNMSAEEKLKPYEVDYKKKNGETFIGETVGSVVKDAHGNIIGFKGIIRNISKRKEEEEELVKAKEDAEKATRLKDKFVSLVSHDLKGPLTSVMGFLKLIQGDEQSSISKTHKALIESALASSNNMVELIEDVLSLSRIKSGKVAPEKKFMDANIIGVSILANLGQSAVGKGVGLVNKIPEKSRIYADKTLLYEVIQNLVSNSIKFCNKGDTIELFTPDDKRVAIGVKDTGIGIQPDRAGKLFTLDSKTSTQGTAGETGTGLGLPLSKEIMEAHSGDLTFESVEGEGATFLAELPYVKPLVLLVDDEKLSRDILKAFLAKLDVDTLEAEDGKEAIEIIKESKPHLIITDISMPVMNGFDLIRAIKRDGNYSSIPVIVMTSDTLMETREKAFAYGASDFTAKNIEPNDFIPRVRRYIG